MPSAPPGQTKTRAHNHNVQSLAKTQCCSLCPAKFTRITHLNRHLRSHANERRHRCNICKSSEFTRSDLLSRHQRRCGKVVSPSRRKSCEACAASKVKCNLQHPCASCVARGRECIFRTDPKWRKMSCEACAASKIKCDLERPCAKCAARGRDCIYRSEPEQSDAPFEADPGQSDDAQGEADSQGSVCSPLGVRGNAAPTMTCSPVAEGPPMTSRSPCPSFPNFPPMSQSEDLLQNLSPPRSEDLQPFGEQQTQAFSPLYDVGVYENLSPSSWSPLSPISPSIFPCLLTLSPTFVDDRRTMNKAEGYRYSGAAPSVSLAGETISIPVPVPLPPRSNMLMAQPTIMLDLSLFFTRFLAHVPLIHAPTWKMAETPVMLVRIFHACGALFVRTPNAAAFVEATLTSVTAEIDEEFSVLGISYRHIHLLVALVLLQTVYLFQRESAAMDQSRPPLYKYHTMLVAMIRRTALIERVGTWRASEWNDPSSLETAWIEWVQFVTVQRTLLLAFLHDCNHCIYFAYPPAFSPTELAVHLPCDEELWHAPSAAHWFVAAHTPSPYGVGIDRIYGVNMQRALAALATPAAPSFSAAATDTAPPSHTPAGLPLPPFALFLLIHTVLRTISVTVGQRRASPVLPAPARAEFTRRMQRVLDNWLQLWLLTPEGARESESGAPIPPFVCNSLPAYWIAQLSLWENS
ncbi:hypothetical protein C8R47DRAFT_1032458 [Mycena vitilis]|nr:hypothetical protein C8R47DRAFT_1032458 [Mycena vitilis]